MQLKDIHRLLVLNTDDAPADLQPGEVTDMLNMRSLSSSSQHGSGNAETLQGEVSVLINPNSLITYYGTSIGGNFVYPGFLECKIGNQVWMKKNWDAAYPGSKVYNDDENNRDVYGGLYTHGQILASDFCPDGWHVPTEAETDILIAELLGEAVAGGKLKDIGWWDAPNTGADDSSGFKGMPGGGFGMDVMYYGAAIGSDLVYDLLGSTGLLWLADEVPDVVPPVTYNDYFLSSKDELNKMWVNLVSGTDENSVVYAPVGGFNDSILYWSSSEVDFENVWTQNLDVDGVGDQSVSYKAINGAGCRACRAFTSTIPYSLRDIGPAGGYIFYKSGNNYLEAAPIDCANSVWSNIAGTAVTGTGTAIGTGQANTLAIINQVGHTDSAAKLCDDLVIVH